MDNFQNNYVILTQNNYVILTQNNSWISKWKSLPLPGPKRHQNVQRLTALVCLGPQEPSAPGIIQPVKPGEYVEANKVAKHLSLSLSKCFPQKHTLTMVKLSVGRSDTADVH